MDSNPGGVGLLGSVERFFELGWRNVVAVPVQPCLVEPVDPRQGGEFEFVDVVPSGGVRAVDAFGLVEPVRCLGQRVVIGIRDRLDRGPGSDLLEPFGEGRCCVGRSRAALPPGRVVA